MTKGERLYKDMKALEEIERLDMDMDKEGATLRRIKILGQEKHTSRQAHELVSLHLMCIIMCLLALHKFLNLICMLVWCMLVVEFD
jgi:uncharacterized membrane protein